MLSKRTLTRVVFLALACWMVWAGCGAESQPPAPQRAARTGGLAAYELVLGPKVIEKVRYNASGLTFSSNTKSLYVVLDYPPTVVELALNGSTKRAISLRGFRDTEGITHIKGDMFAIAEEGRRTLVLARIAAETKVVDYAACTRILLDPKTGGNTGLEGVAYDAKNRRFFAVKEKRPRKIYEMSEPTDEKPTPELKHPWDVEKHNLGMRDLSGIYYEPGSGRLLILSDESKCVVECTTAGVEVSRLSLMSGDSGLGEGPPKPEGITMDDKGNLYICSEPNLLYVFARKVD